MNSRTGSVSGFMWPQRQTAVISFCDLQSDSSASSSPLCVTAISIQLTLCYNGTDSVSAPISDRIKWRMCFYFLKQCDTLHSCWWVKTGSVWTPLSALFSFFTQTTAVTYVYWVRRYDCLWRENVYNEHLYDSSRWHNKDTVVGERSGRLFTPPSSVTIQNR